MTDRSSPYCREAMETMKQIKMQCLFCCQVVRPSRTALLEVADTIEAAISP